MAMLSVMIAPHTPTYNHIDEHASGRVRHAYLAACGMVSRRFNDKGETYTALPAEARLVAAVSLARAFSWLGLYLLMTVCCVLTLRTTLSRENLWLPEEQAGEGRTASKTDVLNVGMGLTVS